MSHIIDEELASLPISELSILNSARKIAITGKAVTDCINTTSWSTWHTVSSSEIEWHRSNLIDEAKANGMKKPRIPTISARLPDFQTMEGSIFTPTWKINSMMPNTDKVSSVILPSRGKILFMNAKLCPRIEGPRITPP
jgi:hypothetical protein